LGRRNSELRQSWQEVPGAPWWRVERVPGAPSKGYPLRLSTAEPQRPVHRRSEFFKEVGIIICFVDVARRFECDEDRGRFEATPAKIAKAKPTEGALKRAAKD
jgi:hypothetical protein